MGAKSLYFLINLLGHVVAVSSPGWEVTFDTISFFPDCLELDAFLQTLDELTVELPPEAD